MSTKPFELPLTLYRDILRKLAPEALRLVRKDLQLKRDGWDVYYAVDHYEISRFCFPIDVSEVGHYTEEEIDEISDSQLAYHEVFYSWDLRPVLLREYIDELHGLRRFLSYSTDVYLKADILNQYIEMVGLKEETFPDVKATDELIAFLKNNLNDVLAVALGVFSVGAERLKEITTSRLLYDHLDGRGAELVNISSLRYTRRADRFFSNLESYEDGLWARRRDPKEYDRMRAKFNNRRDAEVIDKIVQLNQTLNQNRILILYLSSAPKTVKLFKDKRTRKWLPVIEGQNYNILRTTRHLYAYRVNKGLTDEETINNIDNLLSLIERVARIKRQLEEREEQCRICATETDTFRLQCEFRAICDGLRDQGNKVIDPSRKEYANINLVRNLNQLKKKKVSRQDPNRYYIDFLREIDATKTIRDAVLKQIEMFSNLLEMKYHFASSVPSDLSRVPSTRVTVKEYVSCVLQEFPLALRINDRGLASINMKIQEYVLTPKTEREKKLRLLAEAFGDYLSYDAKLKLDDESELVRGYLYLVLQQTDMIEQTVLICKRQIERDDELGREFQYLLSFAIRHLGHYEECDDLCSAAIKKYPEDARFFHARSLNTFEWLKVKGDTRTRSISDAIADGEMAAKQYGNETLMMAANYNNLAYFYSEGSGAGVSLEKAMYHLDALKKIIPRDQWDPMYPEFFDTEATVYLAYVKHNMGAEDAALKADVALESIIKANKLYPKRTYRKREAEIRRWKRLLSTVKRRK